MLIKIVMEHQEVVNISKVNIKNKVQRHVILRHSIFFQFTSAPSKVWPINIPKKSVKVTGCPDFIFAWSRLLKNQEQNSFMHCSKCKKNVLPQNNSITKHKMNFKNQFV